MNNTLWRVPTPGCGREVAATTAMGECSLCTTTLCLPSGFNVVPRRYSAAAQARAAAGAVARLSAPNIRSGGSDTHGCATAARVVENSFVVQARQDPPAQILQHHCKSDSEGRSARRACVGEKKSSCQHRSLAPSRWRSRVPYDSSCGAGSSGGLARPARRLCFFPSRSHHPPLLSHS